MAKPPRVDSGISRPPVLLGDAPVEVAWPGHPTVLVQPGGPAPEWVPAEALGPSFGAADTATTPSED